MPSTAVHSQHMMQHCATLVSSLAAAPDNDEATKQRRRYVVGMVPADCGLCLESSQHQAVFRDRTPACQ